ncbi:Hypothetical predicted protein [Pelobates cultripes]|uniref:Uncharacterized protein n=1 Tax=Pelobates cultripes TaxID=61616 RepID=A0AAD1S1T4_PELCU|nr:Hypothetical predicted protein [Pelobates cultripes]
MAQQIEEQLGQLRNELLERQKEHDAWLLRAHTRIAGVIHHVALHADKKSEYEGETVVIPSHLVKGVHDKFMEYLDQVPPCRKPSPEGLAVPIEVQGIWSTIQTPCETETTEGEIEEAKKSQNESQKKTISRLGCILRRLRSRCFKK